MLTIRRIAIVQATLQGSAAQGCPALAFINKSFLTARSFQCGKLQVCLLVFGRDGRRIEIGEGTDLLQVVEKIQFQHAHNPVHAWSHMASSILGPSLTVPVSDGKLVRGTWQSVMLIELDGPRERMVHITLLSNTAE